LNEVSDEAVARGLLAQTKGLGARNVYNLKEFLDESVLSLFETPARVETLDVNGIGETLTRRMHGNLTDWDLQEARDRLERRDVGVLCSRDEAYPDRLDSIYDPPPVLFYRGGLETLSTPMVGIVGTRKASELGTSFAQKLSGGLADLDVTVVSGLASGIDAASHRGALNSGENRTAAVLGTGVDVAYPRRNEPLQESIEERGCLVSEYPPGTEPNSRHFPERNRIISGLSSAVIVVQAGVRSGAIITADCALEQGREVFAVPGAVNDELHDGCHRLIKEGAGLVECPEDVLDFLQVEGDFTPPDQAVVITPEQERIFEVIHSKPVHLDEVVQETGLELGDCAKNLLELEDKGLLISLPGKRYQRSSDATQITIEVEDPEN
jgi:DNA processing protein